MDEIKEEKKLEDSEKKEEKLAITKGGLYAGLTGSTKGFTIFIIICSAIMLGLIIYAAVKLG